MQTCLALQDIMFENIVLCCNLWQKSGVSMTTACERIGFRWRDIVTTNGSGHTTSSCGLMAHMAPVLLSQVVITYKEIQHYPYTLGIV
jgi:hypothetical protein